MLNRRNRRQGREAGSAGIVIMRVGDGRNWVRFWVRLTDREAGECATRQEPCRPGMSEIITKHERWEVGCLWLEQSADRGMQTLPLMLGIESSG